MKIFCDLDGVLRYKIPAWKEIKKDLTIRKYLELARPIGYNIKFIKELSKEHEVVIATKSKYELANLVWLEENCLNQLPYIKTSKDKVSFLENNYGVKGNLLIDDELSAVKKFEELGGTGVLIEDHESIEEKIKEVVDTRQVCARSL